MSFNYGIVFSIRAAHAYYDGGQCTDLAIRPTRECQGLLDRYRLLYKGRPGQAAIFAELRNIGTDAAPDLRPVVTIPNGTVFRFQAVLLNPNFYNITDLDQGKLKSGAAYVFSSAGIAAVDVAGQQTIALHDGGLPEPVPVVEKRLIRTVGRAQGPAKVELFDRADSRVLMQPVMFEPDQTASEPLEILIDAAGIEDGLYTLRFSDGSANEISSEKIFMADDGRIGARVCVLEVHYSDTVMAVGQSPVLTLTFPAREIEWIYNISVRTVVDPAPDASIDPVRLELAPTPVPFTKAVDSSRDPAKVTFTSDQPIPLRQKPRTGIQLQHAAAAADGAAPAPAVPPEPQILVQRMPNPDVSRLVLEDGVLKSRMHLTIS